MSKPDLQPAGQPGDAPGPEHASPHHRRQCGLGQAAAEYAAAGPDAAVGEGLAVRGEEVQQAGAAVDSWLRRVGLQ